MDVSESFPIEQLPLEAVEVVCNYLTTQELAACCAVSHNMRDLFGCDFVWRPRCDKELASYLSTTPCKVQPGFVSPDLDLEHNTLPPIPHWRMAFMKQNHLWNNWRQGKKTQEEIRNQHSDRSHHNAIFHAFQTNDIIIALFKDKIELLDVREYPAADATEIIRFAPNFSNGLKINAENDMLLTVYRTGVQVFHLDFSSKQHSLEHVFFFEDSQKLASNAPCDVKKAFDTVTLSRSINYIRVVAGSLFIGTLQGNTTLHIWDLKSGLKVKEQTCPIKRGMVEDMKASDTMNLVLSVRQEGQPSITFLVYSLTQFSFLPFRETFQDQCHFSVLKDSLAIQANNSLHVFNYQTSQSLLKDHPVDSEPKVLKDGFLFVEGGILKLFIPATRSVVSLSLSGISFFEVIGSKFVQVRKNWNFETYEFKEFNNTLKKTSMILPFTVCGYFLNKASTRYIVRYAVGEVIHFW